MFSPHAVILELAGANALGVIRSLGYQNIPCVGMHIKGKKSHAVTSKYLRKAHLVEGEEELLKKLLEFGEQQEERGVLFPIGDFYLAFCSRNKDELLEYYHVPNVPRNNLEKLLDKKQNSRLGLKEGFCVPKSEYLSKSIESIKEPVIVKPINSIEGNKSDMFFYETVKNLISDRRDLLGKYGEMVVQEFIPGEVNNLVEVHAYNSSKGPVIAGMQRNRLGIKKGQHVYTGVVFESVWIEEIVKPSLNLIKDLSFNGPLDINLKHSESDRKYYFMEVNFRTSANVSLDTLAGLNLPAIVYYDRTNQDFDFLLNKSKRLGVKWIHEERIKPYLEEGSREKLLYFLSRAEAKVFFDEIDTSPFINEHFEMQLDPEIFNLIQSKPI